MHEIDRNMMFLSHMFGIIKMIHLYRCRRNDLFGETKLKWRLHLIYHVYPFPLIRADLRPSYCPTRTEKKTKKNCSKCSNSKEKNCNFPKISSRLYSERRGFGRRKTEVGFGFGFEFSIQPPPVETFSVQCITGFNIVS